MKRVAAILIGTAIAVAPAGVLVPASANAVQRPAEATPAWFANGSPAAARQLVQLLATAQVEGLNPKRYNVRNLSRAVEAAAANPAARSQAEHMLNQALVAYVRDSRRDPNVGIIYVDSGLKPAPPSPGRIPDGGFDRRLSCA